VEEVGGLGGSRDGWCLDCLGLEGFEGVCEDWRGQGALVGVETMRVL
jgi:hypothetical protein